MNKKLWYVLMAILVIGSTLLAACGSAPAEEAPVAEEAPAAEAKSSLSGLSSPPKMNLVLKKLS